MTNHTQSRRSPLRTLLIRSALTTCAALVLTPAFAAPPNPDGNEPPQNTFLADSAWPMSHRTSYVQGSSPLAGPTSAEELQKANYKATNLLNITLAMSEPYSNGDIVAWGSGATHVYKISVDKDRTDVIDKVRKTEAINLANGTTGAYTVLDKDNNFYVPGQGKLYAYGDAVADTADSDIALLRSLDIPANILRGSNAEDPIVGINMTYDGYLAIATKRGTVATISRDFEEIHYIQLGDAEEGEEVSNSIAVDEDGGIYVVTSEQMYRVQWTGTELTMDESAGAWQSTYENGADVQVPGRLGSGSGSTPSLMGARDQDKFVVITDGQQITNLVLFWRNEIPADWEPIAPGKSRRIAAEVPVNYGDESREIAMSEQSVLVRGYGAVVVSNDYGSDIAQSSNSVISNIINAFVVFFSNTPKYAPYGVEKFQWNPDARTLDVAWSNTDISCPNGIPTMSAETNLFYCIGQRDRRWNVEGLDWDTGESIFHKPMSTWFFYNSFYAATQVGPFGGIWTGTLSGIAKVSQQ
ncbi:hypothetical protein A9Q99_03160 [Gammaproteobacteria bacterium 45_16_T64]|nr:hypothetical protein A9Q99_03160 [Gammaproteobacteria bacterium 45_16_T64]